ncbi:MAG: ATP-binding protein [Spirochaetales bacterium]|nr:ATP-binding protein [Spirochaetales bacterium]
MGEASSEIKKLLKTLGLPAQAIKRTAVSMYEAEVNLVIHGGGGEGFVEISPETILIRFEDKGPGIPDIDLAMQEGYSTAPDHIREIGFGAGMGLPNIKKNSDELTINSVVGEGTTVTIKIDLTKG